MEKVIQSLTERGVHLIEHSCALAADILFYCVMVYSGFWIFFVRFCCDCLGRPNLVLLLGVHHELRRGKVNSSIAPPLTRALMLE